MNNTTPHEHTEACDECAQLAALVDDLASAIGVVLYRDFSTADDPARAALHALRGLES